LHEFDGLRLSCDLFFELEVVFLLEGGASACHILFVLAEPISERSLSVLLDG